MKSESVSSIQTPKKIAVLIAIIIFALFAKGYANAQADHYDLAYIWDTDLESVLDYKEEIESLLGPEVSKNLKVVIRGKEYGVIYDRNGSALSSSQLIVHHSEILRKADLNEACAIPDRAYQLLYNVSYGHGPNLDALKRNYTKIYSYLGQDVGKNLFIEQTDSGNYTLIYRRRGDKKSTLRIAGKHAKLLRRIKVATSITPENSNQVIYGESSHLDDSDEPEIITEPKKVSAKSKAHLRKAPQVISQPEVKVSYGREQPDSDFEDHIESFIKELRKKGKLTPDEMTGWMVYDFTQDKSIVDINANQEFQAASMIKPFVALAFFHRAKEGKLIYGPKSRRKMEAMIQRSNNAATNWVMRQVGGPFRCENILRKEYGNIFKKTEIKEYIPSNGRTYKNSALPADYVRFLRALWNDELPYGKEMRRLMALPGRDRIYYGTPIPRGTRVYNKTGSTAHLCGDMGILAPRAENGRRYPYAIVCIIERRSRPKNYGSWTSARSNVIRQVSTLVYEEMKKQYKLL
ncbi:MAG: class A beta-lactamase-related serine hydrolase [Desulfobulbaceae bacterium]|nr:class A beta-lactamase-related serine hydrolase [Desulfobulbaceae bacterium]